MRAQRGFTLIEVLIVIALIGVLLALAAPSFSTFTASQRVKTASFDLYAALSFARSEAIKRRQTVTVAPVAGNDWATGWTVVAAGVADPLRRQDALSGVTFSGATSVAYRLDGRLTSSSAIGVLVQPQSAHESIKNRCIRVDLTGLPKSTTLAGTTCP
jgi:type IV fimbrial biogenesis protein FimT